MSVRAGDLAGGGARHAVRAAAPTDRELVVAAGRGDVAAFGLLYERHMPAVHRYLRLQLGDPHLADDLTQDVFVNAFRAIGRLRWRGDVRPWLVRCARNRLVNHYRDTARRPADPLAAPTSDHQAPRPSAAATRDFDSLEARLELAQAVAALDALTSAQREVLALRFGAELSVAETAHATGRTQSAVKQLQAAALAAFRRSLPQEVARP